MFNIGVLPNLNQGKQYSQETNERKARLLNIPIDPNPKVVDMNEIEKEYLSQLYEEEEGTVVGGNSNYNGIPINNQQQMAQQQNMINYNIQQAYSEKYNCQNQPQRPNNMYNMSYVNGQYIPTGQFISNTNMNLREDSGGYKIDLNNPRYLPINNNQNAIDNIRDYIASGCQTVLTDRMVGPNAVRKGVFRPGTVAENNDLAQDFYRMGMRPMFICSAFSVEENNYNSSVGNDVISAVKQYKERMRGYESGMEYYRITPSMYQQNPEYYKQYFEQLENNRKQQHANYMIYQELAFRVQVRNNPDRESLLRDFFEQTRFKTANEIVDEYKAKMEESRPNNFVNDNDGYDARGFKKVPAVRVYVRGENGKCEINNFNEVTYDEETGRYVKIVSKYEEAIEQEKRANFFDYRTSAQDEYNLYKWAWQFVYRSMNNETKKYNSYSFEELTNGGKMQEYYDKYVTIPERNAARYERLYATVSEEDRKLYIQAAKNWGKHITCPADYYYQGYGDTFDIAKRIRKITLNTDLDEETQYRLIQQQLDIDDEFSFRKFEAIVKSRRGRERNNFEYDMHPVPVPRLDKMTKENMNDIEYSLAYDKYDSDYERNLFHEIELKHGFTGEGEQAFLKEFSSANDYYLQKKKEEVAKKKKEMEEQEAISLQQAEELRNGSNNGPSVLEQFCNRERPKGTIPSNILERRRAIPKKDSVRARMRQQQMNEENNKSGVDNNGNE